MLIRLNIANLDHLDGLIDSFHFVQVSFPKWKKHFGVVKKLLRIRMKLKA